jgi:23S rRNA (pseudouridine1915-N3)-methyltransferase
MRVYLIAVGTRMPKWIEAGFAEYASRLPRECNLHLIEITAGKRGKRIPVERIVREEGERMLAAIPRGARAIALDSTGLQWNTPQFAEHLNSWLGDGRDVALLVGGPEGLASVCLDCAEASWSLSPLTFPHPLVRIVVAEQLYRAWSILHNHPYHRG